MPWFVLLTVLILALPTALYDWEQGHYCLRALGLSWFATIVFLGVTQPALLRRRSVGPSHGPISPAWDGHLFSCLRGSLLLLLAVAAWQSGKGGIEHIPQLFAVGGLLLLLGTLLLWGSLRSNPFFETRVRHQQEQGQHVVDSGLYGWVRHPGYLALIVMLSSLPLMLHSSAAALPWAVCVGILMLRLQREESYLDVHLSGYPDYRRKVAFRLIPGMW